MTTSARQRLEELATQLHLRHDDVPPAAAAHAEVRTALEEDSFHGLGDRLERFAIELETEHPTLTSLIRSVVIDLHALGV
jgi:hypothetical protein